MAASYCPCQLSSGRRSLVYARSSQIRSCLQWLLRDRRIVVKKKIRADQIESLTWPLTKLALKLQFCWSAILHQFNLWLLLANLCTNTVTKIDDSLYAGDVRYGLNLITCSGVALNPSLKMLTRVPSAAGLEDHELDGIVREVVKEVDPDGYGLGYHEFRAVLSRMPDFINNFRMSFWWAYCVALVRLVLTGHGMVLWVLQLFSRSTCPVQARKLIKMGICYILRSPLWSVKTK